MTITLTLEYSPERSRSFLVTMMFCGFTVGGFGGLERQARDQPGGGRVLTGSSGAPSGRHGGGIDDADGRKSSRRRSGST